MGVVKHGMHKYSTYRAWEHMRHRCTNSNNPQYKDYGGRGIVVCAAWSRFENFFADMGECPPGLTLDRIDNDKNYEPDNCRWVTRKVQARNRRTNVLIEFHGEKLCVAEWAERFGICRTLVRSRLRAGWTMDQIASTPPSKRNSVVRKQSVRSSDNKL